MSIKANIKVGGGCNIQIEAENPVEVIKSVSAFSQLPSKCGHCKGGNLNFMHRTAGEKGEYDYLHLRCSDCGAQCDIGQSKQIQGGIFFKFNPDRVNVKSGFYKFQEQGDSKGASAPSNQNSHQNSNGGGDDDDIPF